MKIYRCDTCGTELNYGEPDSWLTIKGSIENGLQHEFRSIISCGNYEKHFCRRSCFETYFFRFPNTQHFENEANAFKAAIDKTDLNDIDKRRAYIDYFNNTYDIEKLKEMDETLNSILNYTFPLPKSDDC